MMKTYSFFTTLLFALLLFTSSQVMAQWSEQTSPTTNALASVSVVDDNVAWIGGYSATVLRTTDGGVTWTNVGGGAILGDVYNIFALDAQNALCTTSPSATNIYRTTDGGATWTQVFTMSGGFMDAIWMFDANNGFAYGDPVGGFWELYKTSDGGATWTAAPNLAQNGSEAGWNNAMYVSGNNIYFGTNNLRIYYSSDMGNSWTAQTTTQTNSYSVWFNDANNGLMGGESSLNQTTDGGATWTLNSGLPGTGTIGALTGGGEFWWAARQANSIQYSSDNGATWTTQYTAPTTGVYYAIGKARNGSLGIAVRSDGGISSSYLIIPVELTSFTANTNNNGQVVLNWQTATETNNRIFEIQRKSANSDFQTIGFINGAGTSTEQHSYSYVDQSVATGDFTYRLKQIDFDGHFSYSDEVNVSAVGPTSFNLTQNYPNPFNPTTTISFSVPQSGNVKLAVYNTLGQEVAVLVNGMVTVGQHDVSFNASSLPSGAYFYKLQSNNSVMIKKMMLLK